MSPTELDPRATGLSFAERYEQRDQEAGTVSLFPGDYTTYDKSFSAREVNKFSQITKNENPLHNTDDDTAAITAGFDGSIIHGMFTSSIFSAAIGAHFPGAIAFDMNVRFNKPVYIDDYVNGIVTVNRVLAKKKLVKCTFVGCNQNKEKVISGTVTMMVKNLDDGKKDKKEKTAK
mmetsp:Transcript_18459/g.16486  ORF Transcript_18459/g.16486 Transcript_18459/m.16486 type:complete len:175 (-) Transcript_18459:31-555(-)